MHQFIAICIHMWDLATRHGLGHIQNTGKSITHLSSSLSLLSHPKPSAAPLLLLLSCCSSPAVLLSPPHQPSQQSSPSTISHTSAHTRWLLSSEDIIQHTDLRGCPYQCGSWQYCGIARHSNLDFFHRFCTGSAGVYGLRRNMLDPRSQTITYKISGAVKDA